MKSGEDTESGESKPERHLLLRMQFYDGDKRQGEVTSRVKSYNAQFVSHM